MVTGPFDRFQFSSILTRRTIIAPRASAASLRRLCFTARLLDQYEAPYSRDEFTIESDTSLQYGWMQSFTRAATAVLMTDEHVEARTAVLCDEVWNEEDRTSKTRFM